MKPSIDDVADMVGALMSVVTGIERAKRQGQASTLAALYAIAAREHVRPSELSEELGLHQSSVTRQVQALQAAGHVQIVPDPADGRSCLVSITEAGRAETERLTRIGLERFALFVADWEPEEVRTLARLLRKFDTSKARAAASNELRPGGRSWQRKRETE